jgi:hypothetical protein
MCVCMYVLYVYVCMHERLYSYVCMYVCMHVCVNVCMFINMSNQVN